MQKNDPKQSSFHLTQENDLQQFSFPMTQDAAMSCNFMENSLSEDDLDSSTSIIAETASMTSSEDGSDPLKLKPKLVVGSEKKHDPVPDPASLAPPMFDVREILCKDPIGLKICQRLDRNGALSRPDKKSMVHLLCDHIVGKHGYLPPTYVKAEMARGIVETFPSLKDPKGSTGFEIFYCKGALKMPASGYLENRLAYLRRESYQAIGIDVKPQLKKQRRIQSSTASTSNTPEPEHQVEADQEIKIQWMKSNTSTDDRNKVEQYMQETALYRQRWIKSSKMSTSEILGEFPRLTDNGMIEQDFEIVHGVTTSNKLYEKWPSLAKRLFDWCKKTDPQALHLIDAEEIAPGEIDQLKEEQKNNLAFGLLPILFTARRKGKGGRFSVKEAQLGFIDVQNENIAIDKFLAELDPQTRPQPFILIIGGSLLNPQQVFVIVERIALEKSTLLKAIDVCYKAFYVLDLDYQPQSKGAWEFLQATAYEMEEDKVQCSNIRMFRAFESYTKN